MSKNQTLSASEARRTFFSLVRDLSDGRIDPVRVQGPSGNIVLLSEEDWENIQETIYVMSSPGFQKRFEEGEREIREGTLVTSAELRRRGLL